MAELMKKSTYKLETTDGPHTLWESTAAYNTHPKEPVLFCFRALREEDAKKSDSIGVKLLGRTYYKADMLVVHERGFKVLKQVWVTDDPIDV